METKHKAALIAGFVTITTLFSVNQSLAGAREDRWGDTLELTHPTASHGYVTRIVVDGPCLAPGELSAYVKVHDMTQVGIINFDSKMKGLTGPIFTFADTPDGNGEYGEGWMVRGDLVCLRAITERGSPV